MLNVSHRPGGGGGVGALGLGGDGVGSGGLIRDVVNYSVFNVKPLCNVCFSWSPHPEGLVRRTPILDDYGRALQ